MRNWILRDLCDDNLLEAVERNLFEHFYFLPSRHPKMHVVTEEDLIMIDTHLPSSHLNMICATKNAFENIEKKIEKIHSHFSAKKFEFSWLLGPTGPIDLISHRLFSSGYNLSKVIDAMIINLSVFRKKLKYLPGYRVQQALTKATILDVAKVYSKKYTHYKDITSYFEKISNLAFHTLDPMRFFIGYLDKEPLIVGEIYFGAGLAGLKIICQKEDSEKRKDYIMDIIVKMILVAQQQGYHFATITVEKELYTCAEELGFKKYCEFLNVF